MTVTAAWLKGLIEAELDSVADLRVVEFVRHLLVEPNVVERGWDYGGPGQTFPCWTVLDDREESGAGIAYCQSGFGPRCPWGLVWTADGMPSSMGMDSGWFPTFMEAFFDSFPATRLPIWRVFSIEALEPAAALTDETSWQQAWAACEAIRKAGLASGYLVHHAIECRVTPSISR